MHLSYFLYNRGKKKSAEGLRHEYPKVVFATSPGFLKGGGWNGSREKGRPAYPKQQILTFVLISLSTSSVPHGLLCQVGCWFKYSLINLARDLPEEKWKRTKPRFNFNSKRITRFLLRKSSLSFTEALAPFFPFFPRDILIHGYFHVTFRSCCSFNMSLRSFCFISFYFSTCCGDRN